MTAADGARILHGNAETVDIGIENQKSLFDLFYNR